MQRLLYISPFIFTWIISIVLFGFMYGKKNNIWARNIFMLIIVVASLWAVSEVGFLVADSFEMKILWNVLTYACTGSIPIIWFFFCRLYTGHDSLSTLCRILPALPIPLISLFLAINVAEVGMLWENINYVDKGLFFVIEKDYGIWLWIHIAYVYFYLIYGVFTLFSTDEFSSKHILTQKKILLIGVLFPWTGNFIYLFFGNPMYCVDYTPFVFTITFSAVLFSLLFHGFLDLKPLAYKYVFDNFKDSVMVFDKKEALVSANHSSKDMFNVDSGLSHTFSSIFSNKISIMECYAGAKAELDTVECTCEVAGNIFSIIISPLTGDNGEFEGVTFSARDITQSEQNKKKIGDLYETLQIINKLLRHDISNNLTVSRGYMELISGQDVYKQKAIEAIDKSFALITEFREQEEHILNPMDLTPISIKDIAKKVKKDHPFVDVLMDCDCTILADNAIFPVIDNIICNAVKHGQAESIVLDCYDNGKYCNIKVSDNGIGIPTHIKERIFEESFSYGTFKGTGLGLYISKKILGRYGARILVEDNDPRGTNFILELQKHLQ